jgi:antitoxin component of RelBE/YafQ-DinJ toxin-antitoxin module
MATLTIHGIDPVLKNEAAEILKSHGMTAKSAISAFLRSVVVEHKEGRCFCHDLEVNNETLLVFKETDRGENLNPCKDVDELFLKLGLHA